ncbi:hypothetical protein GJ496_001894 [Pomphorhynchus laevis]|nr:hypothetical protein GJ496_001894 [Pomphorhynchus laevis]
MLNCQQPPNKFKFINDTFTARVSEFSKPGHLILTIKATGADNISYALHSSTLPAKFVENQLQNNEHSTMMFLLNPTTGQLTLQGELDAEKQNEYRLVVRASSSPKGSASIAFATITIYVHDENDCRPKLHIMNASTGLETDDFYIFENTFDIQRPIALITTSDRDSGRNGDIILFCNFTSHFVISLLHRSPDLSTYSLTTKKAFDFENEPLVWLKFKAIDRGYPSPLHSSKVILLHIQNINDNPPKFQEQVKLLHFTVTENNAKNQYIATIKAIDADRDVLQFKLSADQHSDTFAIEPETGDLSVRQVLDRESVDRYSFKVIVSDPGYLSDIIDITITVEDENDNGPTWLVNQFNFSIGLKSQYGSIIGNVAAYDLDNDINSKCVYEILNSQPCLTITKTTGLLVLSCSESSLTFRMLMNVTFITVIATNVEFPYFNNTVPVFIKFIDEYISHPILLDLTNQRSVGFTCASTLDDKADDCMIMLHDSHCWDKCTYTIFTQKQMSIISNNQLLVNRNRLFGGESIELIQHLGALSSASDNSSNTRSINLYLYRQNQTNAIYGYINDIPKLFTFVIIPIIGFPVFTIAILYICIYKCTNWKETKDCPDSTKTDCKRSSVLCRSSSMSSLNSYNSIRRHSLVVYQNKQPFWIGVDSDARVTSIAMSRRILDDNALFANEHVESSTPNVAAKSFFIRDKFYPNFVSREYVV